MGGLDFVERAVVEAFRPVEDIGYLSISIEVAAISGVAVSLWLPCATRVTLVWARVPDDAWPVAAGVTHLALAVAASLAAGLLIGVAAAGATRESLLLVQFGVIFTGMAAAPGTIALPIVYLVADRIDEHALPAPAEAPT